MIPKYDLTSARFAANPLPVFEKLWADGTVVQGRIPFLGKTWLVTRHDACAQVLKSKELFVREGKNADHKGPPAFTRYLPKSIHFLLENMVNKDEPDHLRLRSHVDTAFQPRDVMAMRTDITAICTDLLDQMQTKHPVDIQQEFTRKLPLLVISDLLGFNATDREEIATLATPLTASSSTFGMLYGLYKMPKLTRLLEHKIENIRRNPNDGIISGLLENKDDGLNHRELMAMIFTLFFAGHETTVHLINGLILALLDNPDQLQQVQENPDMAGLMVEEGLRFVSPVQMNKPFYVVKDMDFHGAALKRGDMIVPLIGAANWDNTKREAPEIFDISRRPNPHLSFSSGIHFCLGFQLARLETEIAVLEFFKRFPNVELAVDRNAIKWRKRVGLRALKSFPVVLNPR